jgi:hypothetical protein
MAFQAARPPSAGEFHRHCMARRDTMACMGADLIASARTGLAIVALGATMSFSPAFAQQPARPSPPVATPAGFTVRLTYSQKAMDTLVSSKETVIVAAYVFGLPKPGVPKKYVEGDGTIPLGEAKKEIAPGAVATFGKIDLDSARVTYIDNRGPQLLINVYSGRKSSPNNLLDCGIYEDPLSGAQGKYLPIACKLIGE